MTIAVCAVPLVAQLLAPAISNQSPFTGAQPASETRFREMDRNRDGVVTRAEWQGSDQSFRVHDWNGDGILAGEEVRGDAEASGEGAGIYGDREDTFENLDYNRDNRIERTEWHGSGDAFQWLDRNSDGTLSRQEVVGRSASRGARNRRDQGSATSGAGPAATGDCVDNAARIVDDIYQQVLERPADPASAGLTQALDGGRMTVRDIVAELAKSEEHASRYYWHPIASSLYRQMLNRDPSAQELQEMTADLMAGRGAAMLEVIARTARRAAANDEDAVRILYRRLLGREADEQGLRDFTELARREGIETVARQIAASREYRQRNGIANTVPDERNAYESAVRSLYRHVLGRDPDPPGLQDLTRIAASSGFEAVVDRMVMSPEYERSYGTSVVPGTKVRYCGRSR
jgi:hypothetical protein